MTRGEMRTKLSELQKEYSTLAAELKSLDAEEKKRAGVDRFKDYVFKHNLERELILLTHLFQCVSNAAVRELGNHLKHAFLGELKKRFSEIGRFQINQGLDQQLC